MSIRILKLRKSVNITAHDVEGKYMVADWSDVTIEPERIKSIDNFDIIDSTDNKHCLVMDDSAGKKKSIRVFGKLSRNMAKSHLAKHESICELREFSKDMIQLKPKVHRGENWDGINDGYGIIGYRPDRNKKGVSKFAFRHGVDSETKKTMEEQCAKVLNKLHLMTELFQPFVRTKWLVMKQIIDRTRLKEVGGRATAFCMGKNYHSCCHTDRDICITRCSQCVDLQVLKTTK